MSKQKNCFGLEMHPTDSLIHWTVSEKERVIKAKVYRKAYNTIVNKGFKKELDILMRASYENGTDDENDNHNEDL